MHDLLDIRRNGSLIVWTLNRSDALNAINYDVMAALERALDAIEADSGLAVLLFTAEGDHFISGGDLKAFSDLKTADEGFEMTERMKNILLRIENLPFITICLVNGDAYGGGCETALAFDMIWIRDTVKMGFTQANFGLSPGWGGQTRLMERVGTSKALNWLATRSKIDADESLRLGLVDVVIPTKKYQKTVENALEPILSTDLQVILALKATKIRHLNDKRSSSIELEKELFGPLWASDTHHTRVNQFLNRARKK